MELKIEKLVYGGEGLARLLDPQTGRAKAVFVPFVAPGEVIDAAVIEEKPGFARARVEHLLQPSPARVSAPCPYFLECGGCQYQHLQYADQVVAKAQILAETLERTAKLKLERPVQTHSAEPFQYRNRTRMRMVHDPEFAIGYYRYASHSLLAVTECPISSPLINRALSALWQLGRAERVNEAIREVQFFANDDDSKLLVELFIEHGVEAESVRGTVEALRGTMAEVVGVAAFPGAPADDAEDQRAPLTRGRSSAATFFGDRSLVYATSNYDFQVSAGAFFQVNRFLLDELIATVTAGRSGKTALDLYAGGGFFSLPLAESFQQVVAVEASTYSYGDLRNNAPANVKALRVSTEEFLRSEVKRYTPDLVIVDPPRAGLGERTSQLLGRMSVPRVTYVSCDPATLSRDMKVLAAAGFRIEEAHLFDLFPQTFHLETVLHLAR